MNRLPSLLAARNASPASSLFASLKRSRKPLVSTHLAPAPAAPLPAPTNASNATRAGVAAPSQAPPGVSFLEQMQEMCGSMEKLCFRIAAKDIAQRSGVDIPAAVANEAGQLDGNALVEQLPGTQLMKRIITLLDTFTVPGKKREAFVRTGYQVQAHQMILAAICPMVYGEDTDRYGELIRKYWGYPNFCSRVAMMWPRRHGKTWTIGSILACMAYVLRGKRWIILSTGERASGEMMAHTLQFFLQMPGAKDMIAKHTSEHLIISATRDPNDPNAFHLYSLPNSPTKIRGITADGMVFEEAAFISEGLFNEVALPLNQVKGSVILAISSPPTDTFNYFYKLFDLKNPQGKKLYEGMIIRSMCEKCAENNEDECDHIKDLERPPWKSLEAEQEVRLQYGSSNKSQLRREIYGVAESDELAVFRKIEIERFFQNSTYTFDRQHTPKYIIIAIDPCGGGTGSDTAWVAYAPDEFDRAVLIGAESISMTDCIYRRELKALFRFLKLLRDCPSTADSIFVFAIEKNHCGLQAMAIADVAASFVPSRLMFEGREANSGPGVWTDGQNEDKYRIQRNLNFYLHNDQMVFHEPFISTHPGMKDLLKQQMMAFRKKPQANPHPEFHDTKWTYSGKYKGFKDDVCVALQLALFWGGIFFSEPEHCGAAFVRNFRGIPRVQISDNPRSVRRLTVKEHRVSHPFNPEEGG